MCAANRHELTFTYAHRTVAILAMEDMTKVRKKRRVSSSLCAGNGRNPSLPCPRDRRSDRLVCVIAYYIYIYLYIL